ncbi:MAG: decaprenyl-phosphate phosphoribosyltransferase [Pseudomonadota bacterium]
MDPVALIKLCRPKQWIKNGFVFGPLIFSGRFLDTGSIIDAIIAAVLFSLAASATYIVNDLKDIEADRKHPTKSQSRPLASGAVSPGQGIGLLVLLYALLACGFLIEPQVMLVIVVYLLLNLAYTFYLKQVPVVDIFVVAFGFVLRVYAGSLAISVESSYWMLITTLCLALYLGAIKRRQELITAGDQSRGVLKAYSVALIDRYAEMSSTGALVFYSLFVLTVRPEMALTIPFVLFGIFRYWYVVERESGGESPTDVVWQDLPLILCILAWIGCVVLVLSGYGL